MNKFDDWPTYVKAWHLASPTAPPVTAEMFTSGQLRQYGVHVRLLPVRFNRVRANKIKTDWEDHLRKRQRRRRGEDPPAADRAADS
jgi:hypothetical protein